MFYNNSNQLNTRNISVFEFVFRRYFI